MKVVKVHSDLAMDDSFTSKFGKLDYCTDPSEMKKGYHLKNDKYIIQIDNSLEDK